MKELFTGYVYILILFSFLGYQQIEIPINACNYYLQNKKEPTADLETVGNKSKLVALYNLASDYNDDVSCVASRPYIATIIQVNFDSQFPGRVTGFSIMVSDGTRDFINVDQDLYEQFKLSRVELSLIPTLLAKGKKVRIISYGCGASGGVKTLHEVKAVK